MLVSVRLVHNELGCYLVRGNLGFPCSLIRAGKWSIISAYDVSSMFLDVAALAGYLLGTGSLDLLNPQTYSLSSVVPVRFQLRTLADSPYLP